MKNFALIGVGGYIAPKHLQAIKETGNRLVAALDIHDSVGILDSYFPDTVFFTDADAFINYINEQQVAGNRIDYLTVCSPNHLHEEHIIMGLEAGLDVICEKPVALYPESIQRIKKAEQQTGKKVYTIMQLRLHPAIQALEQKIRNAGSSDIYKVDVKYITARGRWYHESWKGDVKSSGGIGTNIGIHLFDLLLWLFGEVKESIVTEQTNEKLNGRLLLEKAEVGWMLCIDENELPVSVQKNNNRVFRSFMINEEVIDFSEGTLHLHTDSYREILSGKGFTLETTLPSLELVAAVRNQPVTILSTL